MLFRSERHHLEVRHRARQVDRRAAAAKRGDLVLPIQRLLHAQAHRVRRMPEHSLEHGHVVGHERGFVLEMNRGDLRDDRRIIH